MSTKPSDDWLAVRAGICYIPLESMMVGVAAFCCTLRTVWQQFDAGLDAEGRAWVQRRVCEPGLIPCRYFSDDLHFVMIVLWIMAQREKTPDAEL